MAYTSTILNDPSAVNGTYVTGVNGNGQIVGYYVDATGGDNGFIYSGGVYTTLVGTEYWTSVNTGNGSTVHTGTVAIVPEGINNSGEIVGYIPAVNFLDQGLAFEAFTYQYGTTGAFSAFELGFSNEPLNETIAQGVNNQGQVVGYANVPGISPILNNGFEFAGNFSSPYYSGSNSYLVQSSTTLEYSNSTTTEPHGVNNQGEIVGSWTGSDPNVSGVTSHGFIYTNGVYLYFDDPSGINGTFAQGINDLGLIVGYYLDRNALAHGFEYSETTGTFTTINVPGATKTYLYGVNDAGEIVGSYVDGSGNTHGFDMAIAPTVTVTSDPSATRGQTLSLSSLVTISDPASVGYQKLELWDSNGTAGGGQFVVNGVAQSGGHEIDVTPANVAGTVFDVGTAGGTDTLWAQLLESNGTLTGWQQFTVTAPAARTPTIAVTSDPSATRGQTLSLSSLVTISDPDSVGYQKLELWDSNGTAGGGQFAVNSVAQSGGHEIDVTPANVAGTLFDVGTAGGTDTLWAQLLQANGTLTGWQQFTVTAPAARTPTIAVTSDPSATRGQTLSLSSLVTISDPDSVGYQKLELWDTDGTAGGGQFVVNSVAQSGGHEIDVAPANVANTVFDVGTAGGTDTLWAQLQQANGTLTGWQQFTVTAPVAPLPTLTVTSDPNATRGQTLSLSSLVTISDPYSVGYQTLELWDSDGTVAGGQFVVNGAAQTGGHKIDVTPANVANTVFDAGTVGGTDTLWAQLQLNDGSLTGWQAFTVTVPKPTLAVHNDPTATAGQVVSLSSLVTIADPGSVGYQKLELWDSNGTAAGGQFVVNSVAQSGGHEIDLAPANVAGTVFDAGTLGGTDALWARLQLNDGTLTGWQQFSVTVPTPTLTVSNYTTATPGQVINLSSLVTISDPANVGYQKLELWDSIGTAAGGQFVVNSVAQTGGHEIDVTPANVANTVFDEGTSGNTDTLWARLLENDGTLTAWQQFTVVDPVTVAQGATVELTSAYAGEVSFAGSTGTLQLDNSTGFSGTVAGMTGQDTLDLRDINFATIQHPTFIGTSSGGTLGVTDGIHAADIALLGSYMASTFVASSDGHGGTSVIDTPTPHSYNSLGMSQHA